MRVRTQLPCMEKGQLYIKTGTLRVRYKQHQMDFILGPPTEACVKEHPMLWSVAGKSKMLIAMYDEGGHPLFSVNRRSWKEQQGRGRVPRGIPLNKSITNVTIPVLTLEKYFPEHPQYIRDTLIEQENKIADAINSLECQVSKGRLSTLYVLSRASGVLAARFMELDSCQSVQSLGLTAVIGQCRPITFDFTVENSSKCGPQPRAGNWSVSPDGFMVVPFSECLWKTKVINFRGEPYQLRDGDWRPLAPNSVAHLKLLAAHFKMELDLPGELLSAAIEKEHSLTFSLLNQLAGTMEEHGISHVLSFAQSVEKLR